MTLPHLTPLKTAWLVLIGMVAVLGSAWAFQLYGYVPCELCLTQRNPYYLAIPVLLIGAIAGWAGAPASVLRGTLAIAALSMLATALIAAYHAGVEWGWFEAPATCGAGISGGPSDAGSLLDSLATSTPPKCDEAAGRLFGLSFAGWNVIAGGFLAAMAGWAALFGFGGDHGSNGASQYK